MNDSPDETRSNGAEPSMDDILASIRRILAEDATASEHGAAAAPSPAAEAISRAKESGDARPGDAESDWPVVDPPAVWRDDQVREAAPLQRAASADGGAELLLLTPEMRTPAPPAGALRPPRVVSAGAADVSTDVLAQLAKAILDRRDIAVGAREVTLEGMVREMLRPLLREWLDRNLPYLIERLVKKEIDLMVNRAERLDD